MYNGPINPFFSTSPSSISTSMVSSSAWSVNSAVNSEALKTIVAVGNGVAQAANTYNLSSWTDATGAGDENWLSVVWNQDDMVFLAIAEGAAKVITSSDGLTWTAADATVTDGNVPSWTKVVYGNNQYVAIGAGNTIYSSSDGLTWVEVVVTAAQPNEWSDVTFTTGAVFVVASAASDSVPFQSNDPADVSTWAPVITSVTAAPMSVVAYEVNVTNLLDQNEETWGAFLGFSTTADSGQVWYGASFDDAEEDAFDAGLTSFDLVDYAASETNGFITNVVVLGQHAYVLSTDGVLYARSVIQYVPPPATVTTTTFTTPTESNSTYFGYPV